MESMLLVQRALHQIHCGTEATAQELVGLLENCRLYPPVGLAVDARVFYDALTASEICDLAESSLKLHLIAVRNRLL